MKRLFTVALLAATITAGAQSLTNIESVEYDPLNDRHLVSNGSSIISIANDETLSFFGTTAKANFGMEVMGNTLFVIHNTYVYGYDLSTEEQVMSINIPSTFMNGMASDGANTLWITDFSAKKVYEVDVTDFDNPSYTEVISNTGSTPNGIVYDEANDRLVMVSWGTNPPITEIDPADYSMTNLTFSTAGNCDGIDNDADGNFYVSSWSPFQIRKYNNDFTSVETLSIPGLLSPADICFDQENNILAIPNVGNNTVILYSTEITSDIASEEMAAGVQLYPNPVTDQSFLEFELSSSQKVQLTIYDETGKEVVQWFEGTLGAGNQKILFAGLDLPAGHYTYALRSKDHNKADSFIVVR